LTEVARLKYEAERAGVKGMIFSGLDQKTSFWQIALDDESKPLTAFSTSVGQFHMDVFANGLFNFISAPAAIHGSIAAAIFTLQSISSTRMLPVRLSRPTARLWVILTTSAS